MKRLYPEAPILAVGIVIRSGAQIVLIRRSTEPAQGRWTFPGGVVNPGESFRHAARREALEETGLRVEVGDVIAVLDSIVYDDEKSIRYHYVMLDVTGRPVGGDLKAGSDAREARWVSLPELADLGVTENVLRVFRQALGIAQGLRDCGNSA